ncbi:MAG: hypothetical protein J7639_17195 [Paenibacillaceae bacterium]|nr:hypothetical protein [Paenibacillaceae bacterium]
MMRKARYGLFFLLLLLIQIKFVLLVVHYPIVGIDVEWSEGNGEWVIFDFDRTSIGPHFGLAPGDAVVQIDGQPAESNALLQKWGSVAQANELVVARDGVNRVVSLKEMPRASNYDLLAFAGELICFACGAMFYRSVRGMPSARLLVGLFLLMGVIFLCLVASARGDTLGKFLILGGVNLLPTVMCHFVLAFLQDRSDVAVTRRWLYAMYAIDATAIATSGSLFFREAGSRFYPSATLITVSLFLLGLVHLFAMLVYVHVKYRKRETYHAPLLAIIGISLLVSIAPFALLSFLPLLLGAGPILDTNATGYLSVLFPMTFAYLIVTKQLFDAPGVLRRLAFTALLAILPSSLAIAIMWLFVREYVTGFPLFGVFVSVWTVFTLVLYALEFMTTKLNPLMFPRQEELRAAMNHIAHKLESVSSFRELKEVILVDIARALQLQGAAIVFLYRDVPETIAFGNIDEERIERLAMAGITEHPDYHLFEVTRREEYTCFLIATRLYSNKRLPAEETQWLKLIISYLAVSLENIHLIRKLTTRLEQLASQLPNEQSASGFEWFRKLMFELQERERIRIASDLHDTTMQDLFYLKRKLAAFATREPLSDESVELLRSHMEYVDIINTNLRQSCFELHPYLLEETGLVPTLRKLVRQESYGNPYTIRFDASPVPGIEACDLEMKRHLFRIVQELLHNARKHSQATSLDLSLLIRDRRLELAYEDDGVGYEANPKETAALSTGGFGLEQLKSRVAHLHGTLLIDSRIGNGVRVSITLPLKERASA